jgi:hypothetical protein
MAKVNLKDWFEIIAAASVVAGLVLVALELRQANNQARADAVQQGFNAFAELVRYQTAYDVPALIDKAIERPSELSDSDLHRLDEYYTQLMYQYSARAIVENLGLITGATAQEQARYIVGKYFYYDVAIAWFDRKGKWAKNFAPGLYNAMREAMKGSSGLSTTRWTDDWRQAFLNGLPEQRGSQEPPS